MQNVDAMEIACPVRVPAMERDSTWLEACAAVCDPKAIWRLVMHERECIRLDRLAKTDQEAVGKLIRDLSDYIHIHLGHGSDPERDYLLLQAGQFLIRIGL
jgi:hypothetical protein